MTRIELGRGGRRGLALSAAGALWLACPGPAAFAADDGQAPIWSSLGSVFNFGSGKTEAPIDYRDHAKLVIPQKMELPTPATAPSANATDWPRDPDIEALKKEQQADKTPPNAIEPLRKYKGPQLSKDDVVTTKYTAGMGPSAKHCIAGPGQTCDATPKGPQVNWNPLTWIGVQKKPQVVLGPEPARTDLTDPPSGYREPAEGVGAKVDAN